MEKQLKISSIGRRKTSIASVLLIPSLKDGKDHFFEVNGRLGEEYFQYNFNYIHQIEGPFRKLDLLQKYKLVARVQGGGLTGQAEAIRLASARALSNLDREQFRSSLKKEGYLSRDARIKERRKYGLKKARKASQSSKRLLFISSKKKQIMAKKTIHPQWYSDTKVFCDGQLIMTVGSTKSELNVDIWSGNHPFYTGSQRIIDAEGRVERYFKKYEAKES